MECQFLVWPWFAKTGCSFRPGERAAHKEIILLTTCSATVEKGYRDGFETSREDTGYQSGNKPVANDTERVLLILMRFNQAPGRSGVLGGAV